MSRRLSFFFTAAFLMILSFQASAQNLGSRASFHETVTGYMGSEGKSSEAVAQFRVVEYKWLWGFLTARLAVENSSVAPFEAKTESYKGLKEIDLGLVFNPIEVNDNTLEVTFSGHTVIKHQPDQPISGTCLVSTDSRGRWRSAQCFLSKKDYVELSFTN